MKTYDPALAATGFSIVGMAFDGNIEIIAMLITGNYDKEITAGFTMIASMRAEREGSANTITSESPEVVTAVNNLKNFLRATITRAINEDYEKEKYETEQVKQQQQKELLEQLKTSNKPHPMGTVAELAVRFGVSKSEIRRRKADGTLAELMI